jgi:hypothetical protein|tara:strand:- start:218 stop:682 length:465 start_codon:yes stop_codon:yes gene_type:complete
MSLTKYVQIAQNLSPHKGTAFGGITEGRYELFIFNCFIIWKYLGERKIIETNGETAHLYNATCLVFLDKIRHSKDQPSIDVEVFFNLFKDRFIKHKEELYLHNSTGCEPKFLFDCILTKAQKQHEYYVMYSSPSSRINEYRTHINNLIDELKKL